jgi:methylase of polypeptide subunit release factors
VRGLFARAGFADIETHRDLAGIERVCTGTMPAAPV